MAENSEIFYLKTNLEWLDHIPSKINEIFLGKLYGNGVINEIHNKYKRILWKKKLIKVEHVGVWGWNSWCGIHMLPILTKGSALDTIRKTIEVGFNNTEPKLGILPHAVLHEGGNFCSKPEFMCYGGKNGEYFNLDNMLCWAKMSLEYVLVSNDLAWLTEERHHTILKTIDYITDHSMAKFNPGLIEAGIEGDWTECTDWLLDNSNVNVNMINTLQLLCEVHKIRGDHSINKKYLNILENIIEQFNKPIHEGGFWADELGFLIHGNNGAGTEIYGDKYFEATVNYFALLWDAIPNEKAKKIWDFINQNRKPLEIPYPVLTNLHPRTRARRPNYGKTVTNGDVWMVLGAHAAAARLQANYLEEGTEMFKTIVDYEKKEGVLHNCIYPLSHTVNDSWDPEVANYGALYAPLVLGVLGLKLKAEGLQFHLKPLKGMNSMEILLFPYQQALVFSISWDNSENASCTIKNFSDKQIIAQISSPSFIIKRSLPITVEKLDVMP